MLRMPMNSLRYPAFRNATISEISMRSNRGEVTFTNGFSAEVWPGRSQLLDFYAFDTMIKVVSHAAGYDWIDDNARVWDTLNVVALANFFGEYEDALICKLVEKCSNASIMSFTYFRAPVFENILGSITSPRLIELTAHVNGTSSSPEQVFPALADLGNRVGCKLMRLCLFFSTAYDGTDVGEAAARAFGNVLENGSNVLLLFQYEVAQLCMYRLSRLHGYQCAGKISLVANDPTMTEIRRFANFEFYYLFEKVIGGNTFVIGCKKILPKLSSIEPTVNAPKSCYSEFRDFKLLDIRDPDQVHVPPPNTSDVYGDFASVRGREYRQSKFEIESNTPCCDPFNHHIDANGGRKFFEPVWDTTIVTRIVYLEWDTRFIFSNGLIFQLQRMGMESTFFMRMQGRTSKRLTIVCTTQRRRWIQAIGLDEFLVSVKHAEFVGLWFAGPLLNVFKHLPPKTCTALSMMRIKMDRKPSVLIVRGLQTRPSITRYFYDCRDTCESSLASVMNGILYHTGRFCALESVFVIARSISERGFYTHWERFVQDMNAHTVFGADITIIVHESFPCVSTFDNIGLELDGEVIVPGIFSSRLGPPGWCGMMTQFTSVVKGRHWNIITPHPDIHKKCMREMC